MSQPFVSNVISQKYDTALDFHVTMYDNLPYQRDSDYCNAEKLCMISGRVVKYYLCLNQPEAYTINNKDDEIEEILAKEEAKYVEMPALKKISEVSSSDDDAITTEQIQTLLDDNAEASSASSDDTDDDNDIDAPAGAVNSFADVEDW